MRKIAIIGRGRVATHLGKALSGAGHSVVMCGGRVRVCAVPRDVDMVVLAVKDECIGEVSVGLAEEMPEGVMVVHTAGAVGMEVLRERVRHTEPLYELKPEERKQELAGCFAMLPHAKVSGKHVLLCDDIYTTGSTFAEAAQVLLDAGAARVSALALCAAQANWE